MFGAPKPDFRSLATLSECRRRTLDRKELRHRAVSLRQHGFLVINDIDVAIVNKLLKFAEDTKIFATVVNKDGVVIVGVNLYKFM